MLCDCVADVDGQWRVDVVMNIRPSSSIGLLFALVGNHTIPLSVSVMSQEPNDAVKLLHLNLLHHYSLIIVNDSQIIIFLICHLSPKYTCTLTLSTLSHSTCRCF